MKMKEHTFNYEAFQADPEGYVFTEEDIRYLKWGTSHCEHVSNYNKCEIIYVNK